MNNVSASDKNKKLKTVIAFLLVTLVLAITIPFFVSVTKDGERVEEKVAKKCLKCHKDIAKKFDLRYVHKPFKKQYCTDCHTSENHPPKKSKLKVSLKNLCFSCHKDVADEFKMSHVHSPFKKGSCIDCHDPHASKYTAILTKSPEELCFGCHRVKEDLELAYVHSPFERGQCMGCHNAHASSSSALLRDGEKEICFTCHKSVASLSNLTYLHSPFEDDNCTVCHRPHSSSYDVLLSNTNIELCYTCHPTIRDEFKKVSHHPLGSSEMPNCATCHKPHASLSPALINTSVDELCLSCHAGESEFENIHHFFRSYCMQCHVPHGSDRPPLFREGGAGHSPGSNCLICHELPEKNHLGSCMQCHDFSSNNDKYLKADEDALCLPCHESEELP